MPCLEACFGNPHRHDAYLRDCADRLDVGAIQRHVAHNPPPSAALVGDLSRRATLAWMVSPTPLNSRGLFKFYEALLPYASEQQLERTIWTTFGAYRTPAMQLTDGLLNEIVPRTRVITSAYGITRTRTRRRIRRITSLDASSVIGDSCVIA